MKTIRLFTWSLLVLLLAFIGYRYFAVPVGPDKDVSVVGDPASRPGGSFTLTSHKGTQVSDSDFFGKYMLVYFGYSFCPDVCRIELHKLSSALQLLEDEGFDLTPVAPIFITVDPERDTVAELADYMLDFHPSFTALTGTPADIADVAKKYKIYYAKREQEGIDGYLMDHQSYVFVMDPNGVYKQLFSSRDTPQDIANTLKTVLEKK